MENLKKYLEVSRDIKEMEENNYLKIAMEIKENEIEGLVQEMKYKHSVIINNLIDFFKFNERNKIEIKFIEVNKYILNDKIIMRDIHNVLNFFNYNEITFYHSPHELDDSTIEYVYNASGGTELRKSLGYMKITYLTNGKFIIVKYFKYKVKK